MQHPKTIAWRSVEGGNVVDEGDALAQDDVKRRWPTTGASRCRGEPTGLLKGKAARQSVPEAGIKNARGCRALVGSSVPPDLQVGRRSPDHPSVRA
jgi:hypothetical protein